MRRNKKPHRPVNPGQLFHNDDVFGIGKSCPAELSRYNRAQYTHLGEPGYYFGGKALRFVPLEYVRPNLGFGELADRSAQQRLIVGQGQMHSRILR